MSNISPSGGADEESIVLPEEKGPAESREELAQQLAQLQARSEEFRHQYLSALAEMENLRKRTQREIEQVRKFSLEPFSRDLLTVADNLERALGAARLSGDENAESTPVLKGLVDGVRMTRDELDRTFRKHGISRITAMGLPFDPNLHQAMMQVPSPDQEPGTVVLEMQTGYLLHERLLRPAMVGIAAVPPPPADS
ncbi:MAG: nucleotide exchange factor GrpE [Magnetococcales bacterium]|nr:nucleotide exchange factor GrpE [Magnetococcales bacterium]